MPNYKQITINSKNKIKHKIILVLASGMMANKREEVKKQKFMEQLKAAEEVSNVENHSILKKLDESDCY